MSSHPSNSGLDEPKVDAKEEKNAENYDGDEKPFEGPFSVDDEGGYTAEDEATQVCVVGDACV